MALIRFAYGLQPRGQVLNAPNWVDVDRFTIAAKAERIPSADETRLMLQGLLAERFHLAVHRETQERPAFILTVARSDGTLGRQLRVIDTDCTALEDARVRGDAPIPAPVVDPNQPPPACTERLLVLAQGTKLQYWSEGSTMAGLIGRIAGNGDRAVVDRTGISGHVAYKLEFAVETPLTTTPDLTSSDVPPLRTALLDQLGLRMETGQGPVEVLVIDRVEPPTEN